MKDRIRRTWDKAGIPKPWFGILPLRMLLSAFSGEDSHHTVADASSRTCYQNDPVL